MGVLTGFLSVTSKVALFLLLVALLPGLPPHDDFKAYSVTPPVPLEGVLALNSRLNNAEQLFKGVIPYPEDLQVYNGHIYTGVSGGRIFRITGETIEPVANLCKNIGGTEVCGRALGLAFDKKEKLYVANAVTGIFKVDLNTGQTENVVPVNETIEGKPLKTTNGVAVGDDGSIYWTEPSSVRASDILLNFLADGSGRLFKYDSSTRRNSVLLDKLFFANGVAVSDDNSFLVVCESTKYRILKYYLRGSKAGQSEVFMDGLPGMPDNIHTNSNGEFVVSLVVARDSEHPSVIASLGPYPLIRKLMARVLYITQRSILFIRDLYPAEALTNAALSITGYRFLPFLNLDRVSILFLTREGKVSRSLHATDGLMGISAFAEHGGFYYMVSPFTNFLLRVKAT